MDDSPNIQETGTRRRRAGVVLGTITILTVAGILRLTAAGNLAATGTRIANLEDQRETLRLRRARALADYSFVTDPARLEARAIELGFGPPDHVEFFAADPAILGRAPDIAPRSPLGLLTSGERDTPTQPDAYSVAERLLTHGVRPASAQGSYDGTEGARP